MGLFRWKQNKVLEVFGVLLKCSKSNKMFADKANDSFLV